MLVYFVLGGVAFIRATCKCPPGCRTQGCHVTSGTVASGNQSNIPNYSKPNIHISQLIATANQKANPEVTVQEITGSPITTHMRACTYVDLSRSV